MKIIFEQSAWEDYLYFQQYDKKILKRINELVNSIRQEPFSGVGKPEALKYNLSGFWSRRIDLEHRLVYTIENNNIVIVQCRYHY